MLLLKICLPFKTHFAISDNKVKANRYKKANGQLLYNQGISRFTRSIFMSNMHKYISDYIPDDIVIKDYPITIEILFYVISNYQSIRMVKGEIRYPTNTADATFDVDNLSSIWKKAIQDVLHHKEIIKDDNAMLIRRTEEEVIFVDNPEDMKIIINIKTYEQR
jgi:Holliday junction resolvase RusA-like endonuclease